ncbi:MAG: phosphopyruvate hydratase [Patescibacteria group bacterium]
MSTITSVSASEILDSRGTPTLAVTVATKHSSGTFHVPSGASTGSHEAQELRDGDVKRFNGKGVLKAIQNVNEVIAPVLLGKSSSNQEEIDRVLLTLDGTEQKNKLGGNAMIGVSVAVAKAAAAESGHPLFVYLRTLANIRPSRQSPLLYMNLVNGGAHAHSRLAIQEYHLVPQTESITEGLEIGTAVMRKLETKLRDQFGPSAANIGDEGGFAPDIIEADKPLALLWETVCELGFENKAKLAIDAAASEFYGSGVYKLSGQNMDPDDLASWYRSIAKRFPMVSIEDPFTEEAFDDFTKLNDGTVMIIGDDLTTTNSERLRKALDAKSISGIIIKPNQIGTLSETLETMRLARDGNINCVVSHRSGETEDTFISDLAWAFGTFGIKAGAPRRGERVVKYNRLLEIEKLHGD